MLAILLVWMTGGYTPDADQAVCLLQGGAPRAIVWCRAPMTITTLANDGECDADYFYLGCDRPEWNLLTTDRFMPREWIPL